MRYQAFTSSQRNFVVCQNALGAMRKLVDDTTSSEIKIDSNGIMTMAVTMVAEPANQLELFHCAPESYQFEALKNKWYVERQHVSSSIDEIAMCPSYQRIIGMGERALPFILKTMQNEGDEPDSWFWALRFITGVDPLHDDDRGDIVAMSKRWLTWASGKHVW